MKVYTITYVSYSGFDNYLHSESMVANNVDDAKYVFDEWKLNALSDAKFDKYEPFDIFQNECALTDVSREYFVKRCVTGEDEYQAKITLSVTKL